MARILQILVVDNYDSFTYNLVQYLAELGAPPAVTRNDETTVAAVRDGGFDGVVISPGPCTPSDAGISVELVRQLGATLPVLGVCLGHQAIGEAYGASVVRAPKVMHGKLSPVDHDGLGVFHGLQSPLLATRYHSLVVDPATLPVDLLPTAWTQDRVLMGIRHRTHPVEGVQFHPESILTEAGHELLRNFLDRCDSGRGGMAHGV